MATGKDQYDNFVVNGTKFMSFCLSENVLQEVKNLLQGAEFPSLPSLQLEEGHGLFRAPALFLKSGESYVAWEIGKTTPTVRWWAVIEDDGATIRCYPIWDQYSFAMGCVDPPLSEVVVGKLPRPVVKIDHWPLWEFREDAIAMLDRRIADLACEIEKVLTQKRELSEKI